MSQVEKIDFLYSQTNADSRQKEKEMKRNEMRRNRRYGI
jgi:hypothetical protein